MTDNEREYQRLLELQKDGKISHLERNVKFHYFGEAETYIADFRYLKYHFVFYVINGETVSDAGIVRE